MPKVVRDAVAAAEWIARALSSSGYKTDFSLKSLKEVDRFLDEQVSNGAPKPGGLLSQDLGSRIFALGSYVGEVILRHGNGRWEGNDADPQAEINLAVRLDNRQVIWPIQRTMKRFKNGPEEEIWFYGNSVLGKLPAVPKGH